LHNIQTIIQRRRSVFLSTPARKQKNAGQKNRMDQDHWIFSYVAGLFSKRALASGG
jgi:hypothetical protein